MKFTGKLLTPSLKSGLVEKSGDKFKLTKIGVFRGNDVFQQFLK